MAKNTIDEVVTDAIQQMVKIGNALSWYSPIDQDFVDTINRLRESRESENKKEGRGFVAPPARYSMDMLQLIGEDGKCN